MMTSFLAAKADWVREHGKEPTALHMPRPMYDRYSTTWGSTMFGVRLVPDDSLTTTMPAYFTAEE